MSGDEADSPQVSGDAPGGLNSGLKGKREVEAMLEAELERLKRTVGMGLDLGVVWKPGCVNHSVEGRALSGEVQGKTVIIYERDETKAIRTLKHEFLDHIIAHEIEEPYKDLINRLIGAFEAEMYRKKEKVVEHLSSII